MQTSTTFDQALNSLQTTGVARLPGAPATWSRVMRWLFIVLMGLVCLLIVGVPVFAVLMWDEIEGTATAATVFGFVSVLAMAGGLLAWVVSGYRRHARFAEQERQDVTLEARGLTLRGVGPLPWRDFGRAEHKMVRAEHDSGWVRWAVMPLTPTGLVGVNELMPVELRPQVSPASGAFWRRTHRWIYVPGVEGMSQREVMALINSAREMFGNEASS